MSLHITKHAAKRILQRGLNGQAVVARIEAAVEAGLLKPAGLQQIEFGNVRLILSGHRLITIYEKDKRRPPGPTSKRANKRAYDRAQARRETAEVLE